MPVLTISVDSPSMLVPVVEKARALSIEVTKRVPDPFLQLSVATATLINLVVSAQYLPANLTSHKSLIWLRIRCSMRTQWYITHLGSVMQSLSSTVTMTKMVGTRMHSSKGLPLQESRTYKEIHTGRIVLSELFKTGSQRSLVRQTLNLKLNRGSMIP